MQSVRALSGEEKRNIIHETNFSGVKGETLEMERSGELMQMEGKCVCSNVERKSC